MYRHPFANPEHLYGRASSPDFNADRRALTPGPGPGPYAYRSIMPMASQSTFFADAPNPNPPFLYSDVSTPGRGRAASLPEPRSHPLRYVSALRASWTEGFDERHTESGLGRASPVWKRVFRRITGRARRGVYKLRALLQRDDRRSVSGFS